MAPNYSSEALLGQRLLREARWAGQDRTGQDRTATLPVREAPPEHLKGFVSIASETFLAEVIYADEMEGISPKDSGSRMMTRWTYVVGTRAVAEWACNSAAKMALDLMSKAPEGRWKQMLDGQFQKAFATPFE
jgi:hypothetical protein